MKIVPDKNQVFDIGRTINPALCENCVSCDFMQCTNYAKVMLHRGYTVDEFVEEYKDELEICGYRIYTLHLVGKFMQCFDFKLGRGLYWSYKQDNDNTYIRLDKLVGEYPIAMDRVYLDERNYAYTSNTINSNKRSTAIAEKISCTLLQIMSYKEKNNGV